MRKRLSILVFAMLVGRAVAGDGGPIDTVKALAALDAIEDQVRIFDTTPTPLMRKYFSASFNQVWTTAMKHNKDFPVFDADPLTGTQGGGGIKSLSAEMAGPNRVVATMQLQHGPDQTDRVSDAAYADRRVAHQRHRLCPPRRIASRGAGQSGSIGRDGTGRWASSCWRSEGHRRDRRSSRSMRDKGQRRRAAARPPKAAPGPVPRARRRAFVRPAARAPDPAFPAGKGALARIPSGLGH